MKVFFALLVLLPAAVLSQIIDYNLDDLWEGFKTRYKKVYDRPGTEVHRSAVLSQITDPEPDEKCEGFNSKVYDRRATEVHRRIIWEKNYRHVNEHNFKADKGLETFWLGINEYADMDAGEIRMMNGLKPQNMTKYSPKLTINDTYLSCLPKTIDWRKEGYVTEVKNQKKCGSCWAFSTTGSLEGQHFKKTNRLISLSEQDLVDCSTACGNSGCNGGLMDAAFEFIKEQGGIMSEAHYPYEAKDGVCRFDRSKVVATVTGYVDVRRGSEEALQKATASVGPISVAIDASYNSFKLYSHGVYKIDNCSPTSLNHGVLVVGYGSDNGDDYWLVKNSWGKKWGMDGYIKMARNYKNMCGIATEASYPLV